jgi:hypothetical protein
LEVLFVAAGDGGDFGGDFFAEAEEDVGVSLFEDVAVDVFGVSGDREAAEFVIVGLNTSSYVLVHPTVPAFRFAH